MVEKEKLGRYEGNHIGTAQYATLSHVRDEAGIPIYRCVYGAIGFEPTSTKSIKGNEALRAAVGTMVSAGYIKMPEDTEILITESPNREYIGLNEWLGLGGGL